MQGAKQLRSYKNLDTLRLSREMYLDQLEEADDRYGQAFESLDTEDLEEAKEYQEMRWGESLAAHGLHIVKHYI